MESLFLGCCLLVSLLDSSVLQDVSCRYCKMVLHVLQSKSESQLFSPNQRSPSSGANPLSPRLASPSTHQGPTGVPTGDSQLRPDSQQSGQSRQGTPTRSPNDASGVQQAPEVGIGASTTGNMLRGGSLNIPPPVGRTAGGLKGNWGAFWEAVQRDHCHAGLVWNEGTRAELREALQVKPRPALL